MEDQDPKPVDVKRVVLDQAATMPRIKAFLIAGKTPVCVYRMYSERIALAPEMTPELLAELQAEIKARLQFAWPEVRKEALAKWGIVRAQQAKSQAVVLSADSVAKLKLSSQEKK